MKESISRSVKEHHIQPEIYNHFLSFFFLFLLLYRTLLAYAFSVATVSCA